MGNNNKKTGKPYKGEKKGDYYLALITYRKISGTIAEFLAKNTRITPNQVSFIGIIFAALTGIFFSFGNWKNLVIGYVFFQLTILMDFIDGNLARYSRKADIYGQWVDEFTNKLHKFFWLLGASVGLYRATNDPAYLVLGAIAQFTWFFSVYIMETKANHFKMKISTNMFQGSGRIPLNLIINNIFGFFVLLNKATIAVYIIIFLGILPIKHIYSTWRSLKSHNQ